MKRGIWTALLVLVLAGCGKGAAEREPEPQSAETEEVLPVYTAEEDAAAAAYLRTEYGVLPEGNVPKVILDTDMTYYGDDAMCLCILVQADELGLIELLGVTVTGGNSFVAAGTNAVLNQLELFGREDIPVYMGTDEPLCGFRDFEEQEKIVGRIEHWGVMCSMDRYVEPSCYHDLGASYVREWGYSGTEPQAQSSVEFMTQQVHKYPGEVTIISVGAATNIAMACAEDASFATDAAGIVYVGAIVNGPGTYTPYADFNVFYDAEAFAACLDGGFPSQVIIPHDAAAAGVLDKAVFDLMDEKSRTAVSKMWLDGQYGLYRRTPARRAACTDAIAAVAVLCPEVGFRREGFYVSVNTDASQARYGETVVSETEEDLAGAYAVFVMDFDSARYWDFVTDLLCHVQAAPAHTYADFAEGD